MNACRASPTEPGQRHDRPAPRRGLCPMGRNTPSVIIQPVLIGRNTLDQVESSLTGRMPPNGLNAPDQVYSFRWSASCLKRCGAGVRAQASSLDDVWDRAATNTPCPISPVVMRCSRGWQPAHLGVIPGQVGHPFLIMRKLADRGRNARVRTVMSDQSLAATVGL